MIPTIKAAVWDVDRNQPVEKMTLVEDSYAQAFAQQRFVLILMGTFALVAFLLAAAGIFAVLSQTVARRKREIGIRLALGASSGDVLRAVMVNGLMLVCVGTVLASPRYLPTEPNPPQAPPHRHAREE